MKRKQRLRRIEQLQAKRAQAMVQLGYAERNHERAKDRLFGTKARLGRIDKELRELGTKQDTVVVSDHAIVRYMERVHGIDMQEIRQEITNGAGKLPSGKYKFPTHALQVRDNVVVTVLSPEMK